MIRLDGLVLPLVTKMGTQKLCMVDYPVVYSKTFNFVDLNEGSNGDVFLI